MAYNVTGTAGNDTLNQSGDAGPGTIVGLAGDDTITVGTGLATVTGDSGNDSVLLQAGNTGTVNGGTENDSIHAGGAIGSMVLFGSDGGDTVNTLAASSGQTIVGGNDSSDGADSIFTGTGADLVYGNGGNDTIFSLSGADTFIGGFGNDSLFENNIPNGNQVIFANQGNDTIFVSPGEDTVWGGLGNDSINQGGGGGSPLWFGNEGADTMNAAASDAVTVVGGQDSADGADSILTGDAADFILGNGGNDTLSSEAGVDTVVGGFGNDCIFNDNIQHGANLVFGNEGDDQIFVLGSDGNNTVFGGLGNDSIRMNAVPGGVFTNRDTLQGNEGNDTIRGNAEIDTISGGTGNDVFAYAAADEDGNNAAGGGPVEFITDVNFAVDRFLTGTAITFATNTGAGTGVDLNASANNAIAAATALNGGVNTVAAQFTFGGRTYLAINLINNGFLDSEDLLLDITGATGAISGTNFIT
jgi:Ca2+-binding RTX toxin-like protein